MTVHAGPETAARAHIIERPRLTKLLDEANSRVILLIAPAGYGKTTLARQWVALNERRSVWYYGQRASRDVAALAAGIAEAVATVVPRANHRVRRRLRASTTPERDADVLARTLAADSAGWPSSTWLVFDDYHFITGYDLAESFIETLITSSDIQFVFTARLRPLWASSRHLLYGETSILAVDSLAFTDDEIERVFDVAGTDLAQPLIAPAHGWPAMITLAAISKSPSVPTHVTEDALYAYFAEELFSQLKGTHRRAVPLLALPPRLTVPLADRILGSTADASSAIGVALNAGLFTSLRGDNVEIHPLLRDFLRTKISEEETEVVTRAVECSLDYYLSTSAWDDAFALLEVSPSLDSLNRLLNQATEALLIQGRLQTLDHWLDFAQSKRWTSGTLDLAHAEIALRRGALDQAEALALSSTRSPSVPPETRCRGLLTASLSAYLLGELNRCLGYAADAEHLASDAHSIGEAVWRQFLATLLLENLDAPHLLERFSTHRSPGPRDEVRFLTGTLTLAHQFSLPLIPLLNRALASREAVTACDDPFVRASFYNTLAYSLILATRYTEAHVVLDKALTEATEIGLDTAIPHLLQLRALAHLGHRELGQAYRDADRALMLISRGSSIAAVSATTARARTEIAHGRADQALARLDRAAATAKARTFMGEVAGYQALAHALRGSHDRAIELATDARTVTHAMEARVASAGVLAIVAIATDSPDVDAAAETAFATAESFGNFDTFVSIYRAEPRILESLVRDPGRRAAVADLLIRGRDWRLAKTLRLDIAAQSLVEANERLTPREREVYSLLAQGLSNRAIANALFISEVTAKVHIRHIFEKLGVRSRTEAAILAATGRTADDKPRSHD